MELSNTKDVSIKVNLASPLRWAGGKSWLVNQIIAEIPESTSRFVEPFVGGASVALAVALRRPDLEIYCSDANRELINFYKTVQKKPKEMVSFLTRIPNEEKAYYEIRNSKPNTQMTRAVRFAYLNRHCFNGLYRENRNGDFNVPFGFKKYKNLVDIDRFLNFSNAIKNIYFWSCSFEEAFDNVLNNTFIYCDPPYTINHNKNGFIKYNQKIFSWENQVSLERSLTKIDNKNVKILVSNANHTSVKELYKNWSIREVSRACVISGSTKGRINSTELLISNHD